MVRDAVGACAREVDVQACVGAGEPAAHGDSRRRHEARVGGEVVHELRQCDGRRPAGALLTARAFWPTWCLVFARSGSALRRRGGDDGGLAAGCHAVLGALARAISEPHAAVQR